MSDNQDDSLNKYKALSTFSLLIAAIALGVAFTHNPGSNDWIEVTNGILEWMAGQDKINEANSQWIQLNTNETAKLKNQTIEYMKNNNKVLELFGKRIAALEQPISTPAPGPNPDPDVPTSFDLTAKKSAGSRVLDTITITGTGLPGKPVFVILLTPDRAIDCASVADGGGNFIVDCKTEFDDTPGTWKAIVKQENEIEEFEFSILERLEI